MVLPMRIRIPDAIERFCGTKMSTWKNTEGICQIAFHLERDPLLFKEAIWVSHLL